MLQCFSLGENILQYTSFPHHDVFLVYKKIRKIAESVDMSFNWVVLGIRRILRAFSPGNVHEHSPRGIGTVCINRKSYGNRDHKKVNKTNIKLL